MSDKLPDFEWVDDSGSRDPGVARLGRIRVDLEISIDSVSAYHMLDAPKARALGEWLIKAADQLEGEG